MEVSKLDAARMQLDAAIKMFFLEDDPVSVQTLAAAACGILRGLLAAKGGTPLEAALQATIRPERLKEVKQMLTEAPNFFKHADRDPDALLDFKPGTNEVLIWEGCESYKQLAADAQVPTMMVFGLWFLVTHPELLLPDTAKNIRGIGAMGAFEQLGRDALAKGPREFYLKQLPIAVEASSTS